MLFLLLSLDIVWEWTDKSISIHFPVSPCRMQNVTSHFSEVTHALYIAVVILLVSFAGRQTSSIVPSIYVCEAKYIS